MKILLLSLLTFTFSLSHNAMADNHQEKRKATAQLQALSGSSVKGDVQFLQKGDKIEIVANIEGLNPKSKHGFHIHQFGDCSSPDGKSAGGHFDPAHNKRHGKAHQNETHAGDLGNLKTDSKGLAKYKQSFSNLSLGSDKNSILGRAIIIHEKEDKFTQPTGDAGGRIACGVIGLSQIQENKK